MPEVSDDGSAGSPPPRRSTISRLLRTVFYALLFAFAFGFLIGTCIRQETEKPTRYIGAQDRPTVVAPAETG